MRGRSNGALATVGAAGRVLEAVARCSPNHAAYTWSKRAVGRPHGEWWGRGRPRVGPRRASTTEVLRHRDVATLSSSERAHLAALFAALRPRAPRRRAHRHAPSRRGLVDARRTLRGQLRRMGEPGPIEWRHRGTRPRRVVLLVDVSGSMSAYADALLRLGHAYAASGLPVEVFTLGTRLTHVTRALRQRDPERALVACGSTVPDGRGHPPRRGHPGLPRPLGPAGHGPGAVVVVFSDGWERGEPEALAEQMRRLRALAHRVVWVNPHRGKPGYEPVQQGIVAALPVR